MAQPGRPLEFRVCSTEVTDAKASCKLCRTCMALLTGSSGLAYRVCGICSELCSACAAECGKYEGETMRKCAQACRRCAATCAEVAQAGPFGGLLHRDESLGWLPESGRSLTQVSGWRQHDRQRRRRQAACSTDLIAEWLPKSKLAVWPNRPLHFR
jgi:hypothetical protein